MRRLITPFLIVLSFVNPLTASMRQSVLPVRHCLSSNQSAPAAGYVSLRFLIYHASMLSTSSYITLSLFLFADPLSLLHTRALFLSFFLSFFLSLSLSLFLSASASLSAWLVLRLLCGSFASVTYYMLVFKVHSPTLFLQINKYRP